MQNYFLTILINNKVDEKGRAGVIDGVKKDFGNIIKEDLWGLRSLAYEIKHMDKAFYANFEFEAEPKSVITLDKNIRLNEDIIRYLIVKKKVIKIRKTAKKKDTEESKVSKEPEVKAEKVEAVAEISEAPAKAVKEEKVSAKTKVVIKGKEKKDLE